MLKDILGYGTELHWLCGTVFGLVGAIATNNSHRHNMVNNGRRASISASASSTTYFFIHSAITQVLGIALQAVYRIRCPSSREMQRIALQLYMSNMGPLSESLQTRSHI